MLSRLDKTEQFENIFVYLWKIICVCDTLQVMSKDDGKSKGFGFVAFEDPEAAERAVDDLNGKEIVEGKVCGASVVQDEKAIAHKKVISEFFFSPLLVTPVFQICPKYGP